MAEIEYNDREFEINGRHVPPAIYKTIKVLHRQGIKTPDVDSYNRVKTNLSRIRQHLQVCAPDHQLVRSGYMKARSLTFKIIANEANGKQ